ncbi:hypothetical protein HanIR_Chr09g0413691 [Helianthus annuus]|nr:hypothetical protein HanIR_Chr09g0413691 [Helianthus annuus]
MNGDDRFYSFFRYVLEYTFYRSLFTILNFKFGFFPQISHIILQFCCLFWFFEDGFCLKDCGLMHCF